MLQGLNGPSSGDNYHDLLLNFNQSPIQILGTINAYTAKLAESVGAKALYLSGAGVANASFGMPDLGITSLPDVLEDARRITDATHLPLLVDIDTGFGGPLNVARTIQQMERSGVSAVHLEDQKTGKRCGHRPNKSIVSKQDMGDRIKAAVDARVNSKFLIMARTDAYASEGILSALDRADYYIDCGADLIFPEAMMTLSDYQKFAQHVSVPILANITEFGKTPLFNQDELFKVGVKLVLYPLSAFRAMSQAALKVYQTILKTGSQATIIDEMQTRDALYEVLNYAEYERIMDEWGVLSDEQES